MLDLKYTKDVRLKYTSANFSMARKCYKVVAIKYFCKKAVS